MNTYYSVSLSTDTTTFIISVDYVYEPDEYEMNEDKLYDLAIARIKDEEGIDLSRRRLDFAWEEIA